MAKLSTSTGVIQLETKTHDVDFNSIRYLHFFALNDGDFGGGYVTTSDYKVPQSRIDAQGVDRSYFRMNYGNSKSDVFMVACFGQVIYERITSWKQVEYANLGYENKKYIAAEITFNWKIESSLPPTRVVDEGSGDFQKFPADVEGMNDDWYKQILNAVPEGPTGKRKGWEGYYNHPIKKVKIRIRKITAPRTSDGGIDLRREGYAQNARNNPFYSRAIEVINYQEVGYVEIPNADLSEPPEKTLNDTNRGNSTVRTWVRTKSKMGTGELKGYSDETVTISTYNSKVTLNKPDGTTKEFQIKWTSGNGFEQDTYYYLTLEPDMHPVDAMGHYDNPMKLDLDGYRPMEKVVPLHFSNGEGTFTKAWRPINGIRHRPGYVSSTWRGAYSNSTGYYEIAPRFTSQSGTSEVGWTKLNNPYTKKPSDIMANLRSTTLMWSDNDSKINAEEFHMYGLNVSNLADRLGSYYTITESKFTRRDRIDLKAEYFAWFKTPGGNKRLTDIPFVKDVRTANPSIPIIVPDKKPELTDISETVKKAKISAKFHYETFDTYTKEEFNEQILVAMVANLPATQAKIEAEVAKIKGTLRIPGDRPKKCGFRYRNRNVTNNWTDVIVRSDLDRLKLNSFARTLHADAVAIEGTTDPNVNFLFTYDIPEDITPFDVWEYQIWIEKTSPVTRYYGEPQEVDTAARIYPIGFGTPKFKFFPEPDKQSNGFWYQVFDCWKLVTTDSTRLQLPYMTRLQNITETLAQTKLLPLHYYMDYTFVENESYQFRTTLENFVRGKSSTQNVSARENNTASQSDLHIMLPWSENMKVQTPYVNVYLPALPYAQRFELSNINTYMYSNINAFTFENTNKLNEKFNYSDLVTKPNKLFMSKHNPQNPITYAANMTFDSGISGVSIAKSEWVLQGFAPFDIMNQPTVGQPNIGAGSQIVPYFINDEPISGKGWHWLENENELVWFDKIAPSNNNYLIDINSNLPIGGNPYDYFASKKSDIQYLLNNFVAKYVLYQKFNLAFDYLNNTPFGLSMYVGKTLPSVQSDSEWYFDNIEDLIIGGQLSLIGKLGRSTNGKVQRCQFFGLQGNQYVIFVADPVVRFNFKSTLEGERVPDLQNLKISSREFSGAPTGFNLTTGGLGFGTYSIIRLSNFTTTSNYHPENNKIQDVSSTLSPIKSLNGASYSITLGTGNNVFQDQVDNTVVYTAKAGNSSFYAGIWENGVWNNGWRDDITRREFYIVSDFYSYNKDRNWKVKLEGTKTSVSSFEIGDSISVSNVVAIDINENRKFLKKSYRVVDVTETHIEFEFVSEFPILRVERDSDEHRILVTKNVWLNGVFFNGNFNGIWNNGIFAGYPKITSMQNTHWIDGTFYGGHFYADKYSLEFSSVSIYNYENVPRLSIKTLSPHRLTDKDVISMTYSVDNKVEYTGTTNVLSTISDYEIVTGLAWDSKFADITKGGRIVTVISSGLIQNFNFYSKNVSQVTSLESLFSESVFSYDSWIDVNYSAQSAVNVGRSQTNTEPYSKRAYPENNLYGYPTTDVLSSYSVFRDSYSLTLRKYRLGSKYKKITDYVGNVSSFEDYFDSTDTVKGNTQFNSQGWSYSVPVTRIEVGAVTASMNTATSPSKLDLYFRDELFIHRLTSGQTITITGPGTQSKLFGTKTKEVESIISDVSNVLTNNKVGDLWKLSTDNTRQLWNLKGNFKISFTASNSIMFSRTPEPITNDTAIQGKELKVVVSDNGGVLDLIPAYEVANRRNGTDYQTIEPGRYTMVEFDVVDYILSTYSTTTQILKSNGLSHTPLHFNNLNIVKREYKDPAYGNIEVSLFANYLPIYKNVNHLETVGRRKQEFFFNKRNLMMNIHGTGPFGVYGMDLYLDNIKLYEVDMIPFFQYFKDSSTGGGNINTSIQVPLSGVSPEIGFNEDIVDTETPNEITTFFTDQIIGSNIGIPLNINWEQDYAIYRTQERDIDDSNSLYDEA